MAKWRELLRRTIQLTKRSQFDEELHAEMQFHVETRADELQASGMSRGDALAQARREFGSEARLAEETRAAWRFQWLEDIASDLRYALRSYRRHPAFALTVATSLALGIGVNSALFTAVDALLWKSLPVRDPEHLVLPLMERASGFRASYLPLEYMKQFRDVGAFSDVATETSDGLSFAFDDRAERIIGAAVSPNFFSVLGLTSALGQGFTPEVRAGRWRAEAVLSYNFWKRRFGGDPNVIGRTIRLNAYPFTVVGVSPAAFLDVVQGLDPEVRIPVLPEGSELAQIDLASGAATSPTLAIMRLAPGVTMTQAAAMLNSRLPEFIRSTSNPMVHRDLWKRIHLASGAQGLSGQLDQFRQPLIMLLALAATVLLVACANVAGMLLSRANARQRELSIRVAIGAGRARLVRQLLAESILLALIGGVLAIPLARATTHVLPWFLPRGHVRLAIDLHADVRVIAFTVALALLTGVLIGIVPAFQATRGDLAGALKSHSAAAVGGPRGALLRRALVVGQIAFSLVMLVVSALFVRSLSELRPADFAGRADRVLLFTMKPQPELYDPDRVRALAREVTRRMSALPGVQAAALAETGPLASRQSTVRVLLGTRDTITASDDDVTPGFFDAVGIRFISGRDFRESDSPAAPRVAIINTTLARRLFAGANPLGRTIELPRDNGTTRRCEIIGIVADVHYHDPHLPPTPAVWFAYQDGRPYMPTLHVRTTAENTGVMLGAIKREFDAIDQGFPVFDIKSLETRMGDALARERMVGVLSAAFGVLALLLAAVGLYSVIAHSVSRRTREIGLRMALGSSTLEVLWLVAKEAAHLILVGTVVGVVFALAAGRAIAQWFVGVSAGDAASLGLAAGLMALIASVAVSIPAFRASRVDPLTALRTD